MYTPDRQLIPDYYFEKEEVEMCECEYCGVEFKKRDLHSIVNITQTEYRCNGCHVKVEAGNVELIQIKK